MNQTQQSQALPSQLGAFCWYFIKKQPLAFTVFFLAPMAMVLENNVIPYALKLIVDALGKQPNTNNFLALVAPGIYLACSAWLGLLLILRLQDWWQAYVIPRFLADVRMSVFDYLIQQSYQYFTSTMAGDLANKLNDLPRALNAIFMIITWYGIAALSSVLVALIMMCTINYWFALVLGSWVVIQMGISYLLSRQLDNYAVANARDKSELSGKIVDSLSNAQAVHLFSGARREWQYVLHSQNKEEKSNRTLTLYMTVFRLCLDVPVTLMLGVMLYLLLHFWQKQLITTGDLVFIFNVSFIIMTQIWYLCYIMAEFFKEIGTARQAIALLQVPKAVQDIPNAKPLVVTEGEIAFENVTFHYNRGNTVFENKSVVIAPKQRVGLVGFSGSGKTTFIHLILRLYNVESGRITIDGQDISAVTQDSLRNAISMIPQDNALFHRSIIENIRYGKADCSDEMVIQASQKACCDAFISLLAEGYQTKVGERGSKLSGGQRQRIGIARAILKDAPILILDEATSQLDSLTEEAIHEALWELMESKTTLVIAHRLSTLLAMDRILVFEAGKIVEDGTHEALLAKNGLYKSMWDAQVGGFLPESDLTTED